MAVRKIIHSKGTSYEVTAKVDGRSVRKRFPRRDQALDFQAEVRRQARDGSFVHAADSRMTFQAFAATWLDALQVRPATRASYAANLRNHLLPAFGHHRLDRITRGAVTKHIRALSEAGLAPATVRAVVNLLRTILRAAVDDGRLRRSPCLRITLPEIPPKKLAVLAPTQVQALLAAARPEHYALLATAVGTGLRQAELLGLTLDSIDLENEVLHVQQQLLTPPGAGSPQLTPLLKTRASRRQVPLPQFVVDALREHLATYGAGADGLLFVTARGAGWRRSRINDSVWKPTLRRAGLPEGFGMHALRHTYASTLIAAGQHPRVIQSRLGHASIVETMDTYGHLFPQADTETTAALDAQFGSRPHLRQVG